MTLGASDWYPRLSAWKCEPLLIPGARLIGLYYSGRNADPRSYENSGSSILWKATKRPDEVVVTVELEKDLSEIDRQREPRVVPVVCQVFTFL
jgi:hypothetical protein